MPEPQAQWLLPDIPKQLVLYIEEELGKYIRV